MTAFCLPRSGVLTIQHLHHVSRWHLQLLAALLDASCQWQLCEVCSLNSHCHSTMPKPCMVSVCASMWVACRAIASAAELHAPLRLISCWLQLSVHD